MFFQAGADVRVCTGFLFVCGRLLWGGDGLAAGNGRIGRKQVFRRVGGYGGAGRELRRGFG